jgi:hypothetical protein
MAFPFEMQFDAALGAVAFVIRTNPQQNLDEDKLKWFACSTIALATATPMPEIPKKGGIHLRNPFKNERKEAEKAAIDHGENVQKTKDALYTRALASGKAIVIVPVLNPGIKYKDRPITDLTAGGEASPQYLMDTTSVIVWQNQDDAKSRLQVGVQTKLDEIGLRGALSHFYDAGTPNAEYFIYIVNPGTYRLLGNRYELARESIPKMSSARWSEKPAIGFASLVGKSNTEFYQTQQWFDATYGSKQVVDGSYCSIMVSTPSVVGCGQWQETSHTETTVVDPGGWRTVTDARKVDGLAIATKLTRDFASFKVAPGETILVDGLMATSHNTGIDTDACKQQADNLVGCAIANYTLYRIPAKKDAVDRNVPGDNFPGLRKAFAAAQYRPLKMSATAMESTPGTFEASWTQPYTLAVQKKK